MPLRIVRNDIVKMTTDAIGGAIDHIANVHKYAREEDSTLLIMMRTEVII